MFVSYRYGGEPIIDETNSHIWAPKSDVVINGERFNRGLELPPSAEKNEFRAQNSGFCSPLSADMNTMSREEIRDRIKENEQRGYLLSQIARRKKVLTSNQDSTNFCWGYGVFTALNCNRALRNLPYIEWSRESVTAPIKGYRNSGGWGDQALKYMVDTGPMPQDLWPRYYYQSNKYNTIENLTISAQHKIQEFKILNDRDFLQLMTALVLKFAVAVGYNWWSHEVAAIDPVIIGSSDIGIRIWNSWGESYGAGGMAILAESKATADDQVIPIVQMIAA